MISESLSSLRWGECTQAPEGRQRALAGMPRMGWSMRIASGDAGSQEGGWLWHPTSLGNRDVLICINAYFLTQPVLKSWWPWTYQNSAVKCVSARAIPRWVTSWKSGLGEPKADNIVSLGWVITQIILIIYKKTCYFQYTLLSITMLGLLVIHKLCFGS
jgi:hypothetical protein